MIKKFMFATGIENSYPKIELPDGTEKRIDEMEKTFHYKYWETDFRLTKDMGINFLRYGPPFYSSYLAPGRYDWSFADETFSTLREMEINPIVDLCHF
jgi:beta-glucosidase/6-phospho-beta-glucosidase/beta-galactosidase